MISTMLLYAIGGYFGTPSLWSQKIKFEKEPGPDDGPVYVFKIDPNFPIPDPNPDPQWRIKFGKLNFNQPDPYPAITIGAGILGGLIGGFVVHSGFANDTVLGVAGAVFSGRIFSDIVKALRA